MDAYHRVPCGAHTTLTIFNIAPTLLTAAILPDTTITRAKSTSSASPDDFDLGDSSISTLEQCAGSAARLLHSRYYIFGVLVAAFDDVHVRGRASGVLV